MKTFPLPANFDGAKFAARYSLTVLDYWTDGINLFVPDSVPDTPVFDIADAPEVVSRKNAVVIVDSTEPQSKVERAIISIVLDEFNLHADKINSMLAAVAAATTLADLKTRYVTIQNYPTRTMAQLINSIKAKINTGSVD